MIKVGFLGEESTEEEASPPSGNDEI